jgi:L-lactate permease
VKPRIHEGRILQRALSVDHSMLIIERNLPLSPEQRATENKRKLSQSVAWCIALFTFILPVTLMFFITLWEVLFPTSPFSDPWFNFFFGLGNLVFWSPAFALVGYLVGLLVGWFRNSFRWK